MFKTLYQSLVATLLLAVILCGAYPLLVTGFGQLFFQDQANGSLILDSTGKTIGSRLIGQSFSRPGYFRGRPSAAGATGYDATNSSGSNLGPTNQKFADGLKSNAESVLKENPTLKMGQIPNELITSSASGLDPHITPAGALIQAERIAQARGIPVEQVNHLIEKHTEGPQLGLLGEPRVNVLELNLALDAQTNK